MFLLKARFGKAIRAVSDNPDLASSSGIDTDQVILLVWILGGSLAGLGGVFYGLEYRIRWDMGFTLLLLMFAAITLGGLGNPFGALLGSLVIGVFVELWTWIVPERQRPEDRRRVGRADLGPAHPPAGHSRQQGAHRMNWDLIFWNALYTAISAAAAGYCLIASGLNVHVGYTGLLNFGQAGFAAIGAYAFAIPIATYGWALVLRPARHAHRGSVLLALAARHPDAAPARRLPGHRDHRGRRDRPAIFLNSTRFTWLTGGSDGTNGWTSFFEDLNPFDNTARYHWARSRSTAIGCS